MSELKITDLEKTLTLKIQEIDSLKAQNGRLIEKLQEEIDKSSSATIQKEIIHKEVLQIHMTLREVYQQGQIKKSVLEKIFNKINELENKVQEQQKASAINYGKYVTAAVNDEMEDLKLELLKVQAKETNIEKLLLEANTEIQEQRTQIRATQFGINAILKQLLGQSESTTASAANNSESNDDALNASAFISTPSSDSIISQADIRKISAELQNELGNNKEELNLILQMINEKNTVNTEGK